MSAFNFYLWLFYLLSASGLLYLWWRLVRRLNQFFIRDALLGLLTILLFTPWFAQPEQAEIAPAIFVLLHEWLFNGAENTWRVLIPLILGYLLFIFLLTLCYWIVRRFRLNSKQPNTMDNTATVQD